MPRDLSDEQRASAPEGVNEQQTDRPVLRDLLTSFERNIIVTALFASGGNQKRAAAALGVLPTTFQEKLKRFGLVNHRFGRRERSGERAAGPGE
jgi:DNA-binding NtrC family response regulator